MQDARAPLSVHTFAANLSASFNTSSTSPNAEWQKAFISIVSGNDAAFQPVRKSLLFSQGDLREALGVVATIALHQNSDDSVFKTGAKMLGRFLNGDVNIDKSGKGLTGPFWDEARSRITTRSAALDNSFTATATTTATATAQKAAP